MTVSKVPTIVAQHPKIVYLRFMANNATDMTATLVRNADNKVYISLVQDPKFIDAIQSMQSFAFEMNPDIDMCYDYVCEQADCHSFVADGPAWDLFYDMWEVVKEENGLD